MVLWFAMAPIFFSISASMVVSILIAKSAKANGHPQDDIRTVFTGGCLGEFIFVGVMVLAIALVVILDP